jgi:hypothetical protein
MTSAQDRLGFKLRDWIAEYLGLETRQLINKYRNDHFITTYSLTIYNDLSVNDFLIFLHPDLCTVLRATSFFCQYPNFWSCSCMRALTIFFTVTSYQMFTESGSPEGKQLVTESGKHMCRLDLLNETSV